ncbi:MAG: polysaccharide deacetylase family protein [Candidatus Thiodiazotropha lotti]|uniref:Polysaccharide deacetylase family protein n=1 Tax=Candidatus Thiodiazotropha lotti TaxID=2792787 RepID=A0A9E4K2N6_9GAMM|nr:polysaccharide deacetylase family protein [Candidatus Thiodiazotropha lotti]ODC00671.1 hypothetical protein A3197_10185 [Candidatus Thiodiazotropha endoloripes]MCG7920140.1 polysaccharide deacetylase family protein [Candidatus Thiodiazotropha lotti]MCG7938242.1 polysaccharide deacetylase family protein [Candidatus Thiodiazotropha lotti]MCG8002484.1 polysaccharide deacetylase family protein [Candidatus Thiodiazotropha lotti]
MKLSIIIKKIIAFLLFHSGYTTKKIDEKVDDDQYFILMYHRIVEYRESLQDGMYVLPDTFDAQMRYIRDNFTVLSICELNEIIDSGNWRQGDGKRYCVITFDDGWNDFYENAFPILQKHDLPAALFLPTGFIDHNRKMWIDLYGELLSAKLDLGLRPEFTISSNHSQILDYLVNLKGSYRSQLENGINELKRYSGSEIDSILSQFGNLIEKESRSRESDFVNWNQVNEMKASGLVTIGSHTVNHEILTNIEDTGVVQSELLDSRDELLDRAVMDSLCMTFCYPNGNHSKDLSKLVSDSGYHLAVTTQRGWNTIDDDRAMLKRIGMHQDVSSSVPMFATRISGIF